MLLENGVFIYLFLYLFISCTFLSPCKVKKCTGYRIIQYNKNQNTFSNNR